MRTRPRGSGVGEGLRAVPPLHTPPRGQDHSLSAGLVCRGGKRRRSPPPRAGGSMAAPKTDKSWEDEFWENYSPPKYLKNKFVWVATALLAAGSIYYSLLFRDCIPQ